MSDNHQPETPALQEMLSWLEKVGKPDYASAFRQLWYERDVHYRRKVQATACIDDLRALLKLAGDFIEEEADNRAAAGSTMSDYEREPRELLKQIDAALAGSAVTMLVDTAWLRRKAETDPDLDSDAA